MVGRVIGLYYYINLNDRPCGTVAQLAECTHGERDSLGSTRNYVRFPPLYTLSRMFTSFTRVKQHKP